MSFQSWLVFEVQSKDVPEEVANQVQDIWMDNEFGNDNYYYNWDSGLGDDKDYPIVHEYLSKLGINKCKIHWWW